MDGDVVVILRRLDLATVSTGLLLLTASMHSAPAIAIGAVACSTAASEPAIDVAWRGEIVQTAELSIRLGPYGVRNRILAVQFDPARTKLALDVARDGDELAPWSIEKAPADARVAFNAGQFNDDGPWGWVVHRGREWQAPGSGSLAGALVVDSTGRAQVIDAGDIAAWRASGRAREAVQSYPSLLTGGAVAPSALCDAEGALDLTHRDSRLAIGITATGNVIVVLTRFEAPGGIPTRWPIGPTTPEMAELMRRLGAQRALMLDGGLSSQLVVRASSGAVSWPGVRRVPLAIVAR